MQQTAVTFTPDCSLGLLWIIDDADLGLQEWRVQPLLVYRSREF